MHLGEDEITVEGSDNRRCFIEEKPCTLECKAYNVETDDCRLLEAMEKVPEILGNLLLHKKE